MPKAILLAPQTRSLVAQQTEQPLADVEAMLEHAQENRKNHGPCFIVIDMPGGHSWMPMHKEMFEKNFDLDGIDGKEFETKFVPVPIL